MSLLKAKLASQIPNLRERVRNLGKNYGSKVISEVTVEQILGGMRGVKSLICDTSEVGLDTGLIIRGIPILELTEKLPEEIFWLLLTGELPTEEERRDLKNDLSNRAELPSYIWNIIRSFPADAHPMSMLTACITAMEYESQFRREYDKGLKKDLYWEYTLEDCLNLIAKLPGLAAAIYRTRFNKGDVIKSKPELDWGADYAYMLGVSEDNQEWYDLMRLYMVLHSDHESGNVSAFTSHVVGSALSDPYYSLAAGLNGLAGPLHGLANQECLKFVLALIEHFGGVPTDDQLRQLSKERLDKGLVIPGYGHAVLRVTDPRFTAFINFGKKYIPDDPRFIVVEKLFNIVPQLLIEQGKAKDPWPNVDAASGALLYHYGLTEVEYYTVVFSVSRALGICSQLVLSRAMGEPITRPKSVTTAWLEKEVLK
ncbi:MAG: citrate (Si)-synthase [Ignavibacteria bacterium]|nr:citrate (Si)-synthase [Ignavibacteria bacterium]